MIITVSHYLISLANVINSSIVSHVRKEKQFYEPLTSTELQFTVENIVTVKVLEIHLLNVIEVFPFDYG